MNTDAKLIKETREKLKLSREKLSWLAGISTVALYNLETERVKSHKSTLIKIYDALIRELQRRKNAINSSATP